MIKYFKIGEITYKVEIEGGTARVGTEDSTARGLIPTSGVAIPATTTSLAEILIETKATSLEFSCYVAVDDEFISHIAMALHSPDCKVTKIDLQWKKIGIVGSTVISGALKSLNCKVTAINLSNTTFGVLGSTAISRALKNSNCTVTAIDLSRNRIGDEGTAAIAEALENPNCKLTAIDLSYNRIGTAGAIAIFGALKSSDCKVTEIDLSNNIIDDAGVPAISEALKSPGCKVTAINLSFNHIGDRGELTLICRVLSEDCGVFRLLLNSDSYDRVSTTNLYSLMRGFFTKDLIEPYEVRRDTVGFFAKSSLAVGFLQHVASFVA